GAQDYIAAGHADGFQTRTQFRRPDVSEYMSWMNLWEFLRGASSGAFDLGYFNLPARACAHGQLDQCRNVLLTSFADLRPPLGGRYAIARQWWWSNEVGTNFLSDLVRL